jgi:hypothetical protein
MVKWDIRGILLGKALCYRGGTVMGIVRQALGSLGLVKNAEERTLSPDYQGLMHRALSRIRTSELQIKESRSLEELDLGRSALLAAQTELQQLIRQVKRERGIAVRPVSETEELFHNMRERMRYRQTVEGVQPTGTDSV